MIEPLSQTNKAFRDTTISRSSKSWFDNVCEQYGIPHLNAILESYWREAVRSNALGPRGKPGAVFEYIYYVLKQFVTPVNVAVSSSNPTRLTLSSSPNSFIQNHVGMLVRRNSDGMVWKIVGPDDITTSSGNWVELAPVACNPYWSRANFTASSTFAAEVLPFIWHEEPGWVIVDVLPSSVSFSPATYLQPGSSSPATPGTVNQEAGSEALTYNGGALDPAPNANPLIGADARPADEPYGGHLQENEFEVGDPNDAGPHPIYLSGGGVFDEFQQILDLLLAAGIHCKFRLHPVQG